VIAAAVFFLLIFLFGLWLYRSGTPYNGIVLTLHKLLSLAALVFLGVTINRSHPLATLGTIQLVVVMVAGLSFIAAIVSGGLLSTDRPQPAAITALHRITPFLAVFASAAILYLLR
jgi:hypothetical protein